MLASHPPLSWLHQQVTLFYVTARYTVLRHGHTISFHTPRQRAGRSSLIVLTEQLSHDVIEGAWSLSMEHSLVSWSESRCQGFLEKPQSSHTLCLTDSLARGNLLLPVEQLHFQDLEFSPEPTGSSCQITVHPTHCRAITASLESPLPSWLSFPLVWSLWVLTAGAVYLPSTGEAHSPGTVQ